MIEIASGELKEIIKKMSCPSRLEFKRSPGGQKTSHLIELPILASNLDGHHKDQYRNSHDSRKNAFTSLHDRPIYLSPNPAIDSIP
jgi:hypothetical protein